jgi:Flp pilus assembly protein TadG
MAGQRAGRQAGQSLVELALSLPVLLVLLLGTFNMGVLIADRVVAGYATRQGARMAALLGAGQGLTTSQVDQQVVQNILASSSNLNYATIQEIEIYAPANTDGSFNSSTDLYDKYDGTGKPVGVATFPTTARNQVPPNETSIGVRIVWSYTPPTGYQSFTVQLTEYTVMKATPLVLG